MGLIIGLFMFSKLFSGTEQDDKFVVGQVWEYHTRKGEEKSTLTIVGVEKHKKLWTIINIYVGGLKIKNPNADNGLSDEIQHLPFSKEAIDKSVTKLIGTTKKLPDYKDGYDEWRTAFDKGKAGVFSITVMESIDVMEKTLNQ
ncbi:hypothetical protein C3K47_07850 [Solitalea longa]|uniref:Uncharacterized protein n=1 Tax=Solitalea longa TaxID=2079460 RepID=A0A2S5A3S6_9SPHI|nr:hypothetical protein [Solitalea longa]POY36967.1 hypothetical protein C3K47_07850 [Solitalea longa]